MQSLRSGGRDETFVDALPPGYDSANRRAVSADFGKGSMMSKLNRTRPLIGTADDMTLDSRRKRFRLWLVGITAFMILCYLIPLLGYMWRIGTSMVEHGFSQQTSAAIMRHTIWLKSYFTGPPNDDDLIDFFRQHQAEFERMAYLATTEGKGCHAGKQTECHRIAERLDIRAGDSNPVVTNSACSLLPPLLGYGKHFCHSQEYEFNIEHQDWWRSKSRQVEAWTKSYIYVLPALPAERFGYDPKNFPHDPVEIMRRHCYIETLLDTIPDRLNANPTGTTDCAVRHIDGQWFIRLRPIIKEIALF
jgi:hypothetical protein